MKGGRVDLDFAKRGRRPPVLGLSLLAAGSLLLVWAGAVVAGSLGSRADSVAELERLANAQPQARPKAPTKPGDEARAAALRNANQQVSQALTQPWGDLLDALEVKPEGRVALLSVEPSGSRRVVRITAEARDQQAMLEHLEMLQREPRLTGVSLVSHQQQVLLPGTPWRYQIQGAW
jgi:hypothetical protein